MERPQLLVVVTGALGIREAGGAVRASLVHYNVRDEVDRLLAAVAELSAGAGGQVQAQQGAFGAVAVLDARGPYGHGHEQAEGVGF